MIKRILLLLCLLAVMVVPGAAILYSDEYVTSIEYTKAKGSTAGEAPILNVRMYNVQNYAYIDTLYYNTLNAAWVGTEKYAINPSYSCSATYTMDGEIVGSGTINYNALYNGNSLIGVQYWLTFDNGLNIGSRTGTKALSITPSDGQIFNGYNLPVTVHPDSPVTATYPVMFACDSQGKDTVHGYYLIRCNGDWYNEVTYDDDFVYINRNINGYAYYSDFTFISAGHTFRDVSNRNVQFPHYGGGNWMINNSFGNTFLGSISGEDTVVQPDLRTGTVTMTDNNGTTITGFEVTAINAYTGENYTVSTETDVAVMTLPMDRTIDIRNPQTGEYEEAPIGYYQFYGQSPGYKMLNEGGIQVAVMPEKYSTYKFCDIGVTSESGYLTGKHQFQIRSRSDNTVLQTGTVSAKSATTGDWYNTTVSGGIATLILPYDTSNSQSQYAGNYYVYATSPGYEDSDYGTQIVVTPRTTSEIRDILLTPIGGIPTAGNVTLRIQAFSETGPGIPNAEIFIAGVLGEGSSVWDTYTASSTGYLTVSVPGNSTYDIVASGDGYYDSARRIEVFTDDPPLIEIKLYLSGAPTVEPTTQPTGWPTTQPTTQPTGGIPDEDDDSEGFLMQAVRGIGLAFGVGFATAKLIFGMLLALSIGYATAKQLRGGAAEFGLGLLGGTLLGVLIGLLPVWIIVVLLLVVGLYIGNRYVGGSNNG